MDEELEALTDELRQQWYDELSEKKEATEGMFPL
jgi:hypothetical protein